MIWASIGMFAVLVAVFLAGVTAGNRLTEKDIIEDNRLNFHLEGWGQASVGSTLLKDVIDETLEWYDFDGSIRAREGDDFEVDYEYILSQVNRKIDRPFKS